MAGKQQNLLPEDTADDSPMSMDDLRVDFSSEEAGSEGRSFNPIPTGEYHVSVTDVSLERSQGKNKPENKGKPYYHVELTIQSGEYQGRKLWTNIMLFAGALYTLAQAEKSFFGIDKLGAGFQIQPGDEWLGKEAVAIVKKQTDKYAMEQGEWTEGEPRPMKNEVKGFKPLDQLKETSGSGSLMP